MNKLLYITYATSFLAYFLGGLLLLYTNKKFLKVHKALSALSGGIIIAFVSFSMLPEVFKNGIGISIIGIIIGAVFICSIESKNLFKNKHVALLSALSVHKIPEGLAIGSLFSSNEALGTKMAIAIAIHCFVEAFMLFFSAKEGRKLKSILFSSVTIPLFIVLGAFLGTYLVGFNNLLSTFLISFSAGIMIYLACGSIMEWEENESIVMCVTGFVGFMVAIIFV